MSSSFPAAGQSPIPSTGAPFGLSKLFSSSASGTPIPSTEAPSTPSPHRPPALKPIKTPHGEPISHPELAFSPSDIGVWEINKSEGLTLARCTVLSKI